MKQRSANWFGRCVVLAVALAGVTSGVVPVFVRVAQRTYVLLSFEVPFAACFLSVALYWFYRRSVSESDRQWLLVCMIIVGFHAIVIFVLTAVAAHYLAPFDGRHHPA